MRTKILFGTLFLVFCCHQIISASSKSLLSPNKHLKVSISDDAGLFYCILVDGKEVLSKSKLGLEFKNGKTFGTSSKIQKSEYSKHNGTWKNYFGKSRIVKNHYNELILNLAEDGKNSFKLFLRAYDEGIAFRYDLPGESGLGNFVLTKELTQFSFPSDCKCWIGTPSDCAESQYPQTTISNLATDKQYVLPLLVETKKGFVAISEADLIDWAGMFISRSADNDFSAEVNLAERGDKNGAVASSVPRLSPWRVIMYGKTAGELITSNIIMNLSSPSKLKDISWIKPGVTAWDAWWTGINPYEADEKFRGVESRGNTQSHKEYIDFAAEMGWQYQLIDWYWYEPLWKPESDPTKPASHVDVHELVKYANKKNIKLIIWLNSSDIKNVGEEKVLSIIASWGFAGVKIDFMSSDSQETVKWYETVLGIAAKYKLIVDFHGAYKPTGLARTWSNYITQEGVLGNEYNKLKGNKCNLLHTITLPFTRGLLGPMDFTPGGFINKTVSEFNTTYPAQVMGTRARQLAMTIIYESPLLCLCDSPINYRNQPGVEFLKSLPTVWDETRVLSAEVANHIVIARRSGNKWYLAAMNGDNSCTVTVSMKFLSNGKWEIKSFADGGEGNMPANVKTDSKIITSSDLLEIKLNTGGGFASVISKVNDQKLHVNKRGCSTVVSR